MNAEEIAGLLNLVLTLAAIVAFGKLWYESRKLIHPAGRHRAARARIITARRALVFAGALSVAVLWTAFGFAPFPLLLGAAAFAPINYI